jgi:hypothetical protein
MRLRRSNYSGPMEVTRSSCTLHCQVQYRSPGLGRTKKATTINEKLNVISDIEVAKNEEISLALMNVPTSGARKFEIAAKRPVIGSFMCRISPVMWPFLHWTYLGPSHLKGTSGVLNLEIRKACLTLVICRQTSSLVHPCLKYVRTLLGEQGDSDPRLYFLHPLTGHGFRSSSLVKGSATIARYIELQS